MRKNLFMKRSLIFLLFLTPVLFFSCGGKTTTRPTQPKYKFTINGVVVKDLSLSKDIAYFTILRDSLTFDSAVVVLETASRTDTLLSQENGVYSEETSHFFDFGHVVKISVSSPADKFNLTSLMFIPGYFYINELPLDGDTLNPGGQTVPVSWSPSIYASGYFISMVKPDTTPGVVGYTTLDNLNDRSESIPPAGFRTSQGTLVYGRYEVYVIAYYKSFLEYPAMPFELADGLPKDNLDGANGTIGAGVVAEKKYIRVVTQQ
jgi:hypothetical protein